MSTDAKRAGNARYLATQKTITVRTRPENAERLQIAAAAAGESEMEKPRQGFRGLWNISFGFLGIQIGFALQNSNMSRVFQNNTPPQRGGVGYSIDKKLRRRMKEKKIAQGHKADDQEQRQDYIIPY